ncbi:PREDICTED: uncharacterized protein LOC105566111 [Vollenhovia emeryi]|uniref:uncharacterized protein LOC105566111 n=1 Tax=Vollenhovia emeryi TaxID=411798 RepID=UPI0005F459E2|nr:PREDICTED: uncharacterized protein LOC105566111 [Vollenhovia emeryi]
MVSSCCICSREDHPLELRRSFHRIPVNEEMRNKWLHRIGRIVSYKGARVCSDHFTENDYHDINPYSRIRKRLKKTAVPSVTLRKQENANRELLLFQKPDVSLFNGSEIISQNEEDVTLHDLENHEETHNPSDISETKEKENASNELVLAQGTSESLVVRLHSGKEINATCIDNQEKIHFENNINDISSERKFSSPNSGNSGNSETRTILFKYSKRSAVGFAKADFSSDEKWMAFLKCIAYKNHANRIMLQKNKRLQKKILIFQDMLQDLLGKL